MKQAVHSSPGKKNMSEMLKIILKALTWQTILGHMITPLILKTLPLLTKEILEQEKCLSRGTLLNKRCKQRKGN